MKIALTGANGGLGSLLRKSLEVEHEVITFGRRDCDVAWSLGVLPAPEQLQGVDAIIHCAWSTKDRKNDFHLNVGGTGVLSKMAYATSTPILFISSVAALSNSFYGSAKREAELIVIENGGTCLRIGLVMESNPYFQGAKKLIGIAPRLPGYVNITNFNMLDESVRVWLSQVQIGIDTVGIETRVSSNILANSMFAAQYRFSIPFPFRLLHFVLRSTQGSYLRSSNLIDAVNSLITTPRITP